jgi:hypothetical protein
VLIMGEAVGSSPEGPGAGSAWGVDVSLGGILVAETDSGVEHLVVEQERCLEGEEEAGASEGILPEGGDMASEKSLAEALVLVLDVGLPTLLRLFLGVFLDGLDEEVEGPEGRVGEGEEGLEALTGLGSRGVPEDGSEGRGTGTMGVLTLSDMLIEVLMGAMRL